MKNNEVASILYEIADFLEIKDVEFKPQAYRRAARNIESLPEDVEEIHERGDLEEIEGVGEAIAEKIAEYLETSELEYHSDLKDDLPIDINALTRVEGLGPKRAKKLYDSLGVTDLEELEEAAKHGRIAEVAGFGPTSQQNILDHIDLARQGEERMLLGHVFPLVEEVERELSAHDVFKTVQVVGSFRRRNPTVGDIDILATASDPQRAMDVFTSEPDVVEVISTGETRSSVRVSGGLQMDLRIVENESFGAALQYFTGSKDHNITLRNRAIERGWKLNEYGLFGEDEEVLAGETESGVYEELELNWIPPELREDTGEIEAASMGELPELVSLDDIKGDLQMHTKASDGSNAVGEMATKAADLGYEYILITDHGPSLHVAGGITHDEFRNQRAEIEEANEETDITVLHGIEANITADGLDISAEWCAECDLVVIAMHERLRNPTDRIVATIENYPVDILAHPQNRLLNEREAVDIDLDRVTDAASMHRVAIEINSQPDRLDLDWAAVKEYRDTVKYVISTDAHVTGSLEYMDLGVSQARRGWCEAGDVLNTKPLDELMGYFHG